MLKNNFTLLVDKILGMFIKNEQLFFIKPVLCSQAHEILQDRDGML